jgi:hypothetical protein
MDLAPFEASHEASQQRSCVKLAFFPAQLRKRDTRGVLLSQTQVVALSEPLVPAEVGKFSEGRCT